MATRGNMHMDARVIEVTELHSEVNLDLRGHLEANRASEAMKVAFRSNMHMESRVIEVAGFKSEAIFIALSLATLQGHCPLVQSHLGDTKIGQCANIPASAYIPTILEFIQSELD